jgi:hypothetical protein
LSWTFLDEAREQTLIKGAWLVVGEGTVRDVVEIDDDIVRVRRWFRWPTRSPWTTGWRTLINPASQRSEFVVR